MRHRWCDGGLLKAESGFRKIKGHEDLSLLREALNQHILENADNSL